MPADPPPAVREAAEEAAPEVHAGQAAGRSSSWGSWLCLAMGLLALGAAGLVWRHGPLDAKAQAAARAELEEAKRQEEKVRAEIGDAAARQRALSELEVEKRERATRQRAQADSLAQEKARLERQDLELATLERQLNWLEGRKTDTAAVKEVPPPSEPPPPRTAASMSSAEKGVVVIKTGTGSGSGFLVDTKGLVATNYHVVEGSSRVSVEIQKRDSAERVEIQDAAVAAVDADHDLALLRLGTPPESVAVEGGYPVVKLRLSPAVHLGERVYALGNPGLGASILEYTLTEGVVSSRRRQIDDVAFIQTSAAINPGNSGGPLLDADGLAVGVVTAKGINVEAVGFAIPIEVLKDFLKAREESPYVVKGTLEEWEKKNRPLTALLRKGPSYREDFAVALDEKVDSMVLSSGRGLLYLLADGSFQVRQFDLSRRKTENVFRADTELTALDLDASGEALFVATKKKILKVDPRSMKLEGEVDLPRPPLGVSCLKEASDLCAVLEGDAPVFLPRFGRSPSVKLDADQRSSVCSSSTQWLCFLRSAADVELIAYQLGDLKKHQALEKMRKDAARQGYPAGLLNQITGLERELTAARSVYALSRGSSSEEGGLVPEIVFAGPGRVIVGRRLFRLGAAITMEGRFQPGPYVTDVRPEMRRQRSYFLFMDNIFSASPDGDVAASGTHIYSVKSRKAIRELPFPSAVHLFSADGRALYLYDSARRSLYLLQNWQANTRALK